tara:strand:- start:561 stop:2372 length:1812 start_codon:yes stop_codon:yes gene_type:complete
MIPRDFLDDLLSRTDIVSVIGSHIELKKKGINFSALCPFHNEKTPSFSVSPSKQFYHCFGCGESGDAVNFLMQYCGLSFIQVLEDLAKQHGMTIPNYSETNSKEIEKDNRTKKELKNILLDAARLYQKNLKTNSKAISYLKGRGISGETALRFHLGVSSKGWRNLRNSFKKYGDQKLFDSGLVIKSNKLETENYDRFRDRLMFPIINISGEIVGFGARSFKNELPKYINSPETIVFSKGNELYGLFEAKNQILKTRKVFVVEGYMDVVGLFEFGIQNVVASLGTSFTNKQFKLLHRISEKIIFMFDGDSPGKNAAKRALSIVLPELKTGSVDIGFVFFPQGYDPDSYIRANGTKAFENLIHNATPLSEFILNISCEGENQSLAEGRTRIIKNLLDFFSQLAEGLLKNQIILEATKRFDFFNSELTINKNEVPSNLLNYRKENKVDFKIDKSLNLVPRAIGLFIRFPQLINELDELCSELKTSKSEIFSDSQKDAIIFILDNCNLKYSKNKNINIIRKMLSSSNIINSDLNALFTKASAESSAIDFLPNYDVNSAKEDLKFILKRALIEHLENKTSKIIRSGDSFDELVKLRERISAINFNKER